MQPIDSVLPLLSPTKAISGTALGAALGVSRVAIKKRVDRLIRDGAPIEVIPSQGYKLFSDIELLSESRIRALVSPDDSTAVFDVELFSSLDSTNQYLIDQQRQLSGESVEQRNHIAVVAAESQPCGQGRRGRSWVASPYRNIMLSIGYEFPVWPHNPSAISLAFSVAVHRALVSTISSSESSDSENRVLLKWPNDLVIVNEQSKKLGGLLVSAAGEADGSFSLTMGVGINVDIAAEDGDYIDQAFTDLRSICKGQVSRNRLIAEILSNTADMLTLYPKVGFAPFARYWNDNGAYVGRDVRLFDLNEEHTGVLKGVNEVGELVLHGKSDKDNEMLRFNRSELSLRPL